MTAPRVTYAPGDWVAMSRGSGWVLLQLPLTDPRVRTVWNSLVVSAEEVLDSLLATGIRSLPGFAVLTRQEDGLRCLLRSPARLHVEYVGSAEDHVGTVPWLDTSLLTPPTRITVFGADPLADIELPMFEGIVPAGQVAIEFDPMAVAPNDLPRGAAAPAPAVAAPPPPIPPAAAPVPSPATATEAAPSAAAAPAPCAEDATSDPSPPSAQRSVYHKLLSVETTERQVLLSQLRAEEEAAELGEDAEQAESGPPVPPLPPPQVPSHPTSATETSTWSDPVELEPLRAAGSPATDPSAGPAAQGSSQPDVTDGVPWMAKPPTASPSEDVTEPVVIASPVTGAVPTATAVEPLSSSPIADDELAMITTSRTALLRQAAEEAISGPTVLAYRCARGHLSPTSVTNCRVCGGTLGEQQPVHVARPTLGQLTFSNGLTVTLDRSVVFGRAPRPTSDDTADRPNLIRPIESGELSRMHASVTLNGWDVVLRDLGSTHGTFLTLPGGTINKLRANADYLLEPGSVVSLAEIIDFTYEAT